jgi:hypothetical protein
MVPANTTAPLDVTSLPGYGRPLPAPRPAPRDVVEDVGRVWERDATELMSNVPPSVRTGVIALYKAFDSIAKYDGALKSRQRADIDTRNYNKVLRVLDGLEADGRFEGSASLNKKHWANAAELARWKKANAREWFDPVSGSMRRSPAKGTIPVLPGDILSRGGVSGIPPFEHWGIYMGGGYTLEIVRDDRYPSQADIRLDTVAEFITDPAYPAFVVDTIAPDPRGGYTDNRAYDRQTSLWAAAQTIPIPWVFGLGTRKNRFGVYDQTCQAYVNALVMGKAYTQQIWQGLYTIAGIPLITMVTARMLRNMPNACVTPCADNVISKMGGKKDCMCVSGCGSYVGPLGSSWCFVDEDCGKAKGYPTHRGRHYAECDASNWVYSCKTAKKGGHWRPC